GRVARVHAETGLAQTVGAALRVVDTVVHADAAHAELRRIIGRTIAGLAAGVLAAPAATDAAGVAVLIRLALDDTVAIDARPRTGAVGEAVGRGVTTGHAQAVDAVLVGVAVVVGAAGIQGGEDGVPLVDQLADEAGMSGLPEAQHRAERLRHLSVADAFDAD